MLSTHITVKRVAFSFGSILVIWFTTVSLSQKTISLQQLAGQQKTRRNHTTDAVRGRRDRRQQELVFWSNDYHISPINDLKNLLQPLGVRFIDKSLSGHCHVTDTCEGRKTLRVINKDNAMDLADPTLVQRFFEAYRDDAEMKSVDAFVCFHPSSMCELFVPFNKTLIVIASTRYELGRFGAERWTQWNKNLIQIASNPSNVVGANNKYDLEYIRYFTGIASLQLLPSFCGYLAEKYSPTRPGFLLAPIHHGGFSQQFMGDFGESCKQVNCTVELSRVRDKYPSYKYSDLAAHQAIVYVPYQVSVMSLFEQYRMNIPLIFPSSGLLAKWQHQHMVMNERTWDAVLHGTRPAKSSIDAHPSQRHLPDPNNECDLSAIEHWVRYSDFYQLPYIAHYNSIADLVHLLETLTTTELQKTSQLMKTYNDRVKKGLTKQWTTILENIAKRK